MDRTVSDAATRTDATRAAPRIRVAVYVVRGHGEGAQVLVFDHVDHPEAGTQVPGGGVDPGETLDEAARRELFEETGLTVEGPLRALAAEHTDVDVPPGEQLSVFFEARSEEPRNLWEHTVTGGLGPASPGGDVGLRFRCYFVPLAKARTASGSYHFRYAHLLDRQ